MGLRYTLYRLRHEVERRTGVLKRRHPSSPEQKYFLSLAEWRGKTPIFLISERENIIFKKKPNKELAADTERVKNGEICFFSWDWKELGRDYDWITNPDSGFRYDISKHWSEIPDLSKSSGDIKYVWEKSRFSFLLRIIRNDYHNEQDSSEFVFSEIESWIDANPVNQGPNWRCSQETSLRILNWCFALHFYKNSPALTEERWKKIQNIVYWSLHHVYHHIDFSRIAVRNNHAITETLFLSLSHTLFPFIPETQKWAADGKKWFEEEVDYQIYDDGTYLQFSMNYHRVVVQLLALGISVFRKNGLQFSSLVYEKAYKSLNFLYQCLQEENGYLPNYGANDGAWFFPLSDSDYRDFRPQLNTLHYILCEKNLFAISGIDEEHFWMGGQTIEKVYPKIVKNSGISKFPIGGFYLIREEDSFTFIKCGSYKDRPSHADNLHVDIWYKGENILFDGGSYKYNTDEDTVRYFAGTASHNTVMLNNYDQMLKGARFIWTHWSGVESVSLIEHENEFRFTGSIRAFTYLDKGIRHKREIIKQKQSAVWLVKDEIIGKPEGISLNQVWHTDFSQLTLQSKATLSESVAGRSLYYGKNEYAKQICYSSSNNLIETKIAIE